MPGISLDDRNAWDDSALIDSWDEALAEYKKYYSIQATGKRLEDVLSEEELKELRQEHGDLIDEVETRSNNAHQNSHAGQANTDWIPEKSESEAAGQNATPAMEPMTSGQPDLARQAEASAPQQEGALAASMPQAILGTVQDENLKNLMMSWYYAGYYTGLYTGQQQSAAKDAQPKPHADTSPEEAMKE